MNSNRVFLALAAGLLAVHDDRLTDAWAKVGEFCQLDANEIETGFGAAVGDGDMKRVPFRQWIEKRRAEGVVAVFAASPRQQERDDDGDDIEADDEDDEDVEYPAHMMAGFAGGLPMLLSLLTKRDRALYGQGTVSGPRLLLTSQLLTRLVERQKHPDFHWTTVLSELNQFRSCNGRDVIESADLTEHLSSPEGEQDWDFMGDQIFREIQVEALTVDESFVIPPEFTHLVESVTPLLDFFEPSIWLEARDADPSGPQLLKLIEAQGFGDRIWQLAANRPLLQEILQDDYDLDKFPEIAPAEWPDYLAGSSAEESWEICHELVELVRLECEHTGTQPCIPDDLKDVFGPNGQDQRRLYFRQRLQHDLGWRVRQKDKPWMLYVLDRAGTVVQVNARPELSESKREFIAALHAIRDFARHVDSPFISSFDFALHLVAQAEGAGSPDMAVMRRSDSGRSSTLWESAERIVEQFAPFGWGSERLLGLAAIASADVFGGMGSWNDQGFDGDDDARFRTVSDRLFTALNRYYEAIVSFEAGTGPVLKTWRRLRNMLTDA